jgi:hypothetical protein
MFYVAREIMPNVAAADDAHERHQLARLILISVNHPIPAWHTRPGSVEIPGWRFMQWAGERLQKGIGLFCGYCAMALMGDPQAGFPAPANQKPVSRSAAQKAAVRPRYRPLDELDEDD